MPNGSENFREPRGFFAEESVYFLLEVFEHTKCRTLYFMRDSVCIVSMYTHHAAISRP